VDCGVDWIPASQSSSVVSAPPSCAEETHKAAADVSPVGEPHSDDISHCCGLMASEKSDQDEARRGEARMSVFLGAGVSSVATLNLRQTIPHER
jgi:hypothetical protein